MATSSPTATSPPPETPLFGIGGGETDLHSHVTFTLPHDIIRARVQVVVDRTHDGLNFFAMQVNFKNGTWAHGGLQDVNGPNGTRKRQVNWGGLVNHGGGATDYAKHDDSADADLIQNAPDNERVKPYVWQNGVMYEYVVERGNRVTLPAGDIPRMGKPGSTVNIDHPRVMWEWRFSLHPVGKTEPTYSVTLHDGAEVITSVSVWNEKGHDSPADSQHTNWYAASFRTLSAPNTEITPTGWKRF